MRALAFASACVGAAMAASIPDPVPYGHSAFVYPPLHCVPDPCAVVPSCNKADWAKPVGDFNGGNPNHAADISVVYAYGGDIELWSGRGSPQGCWAPASMDLAVCNVSIFFDPNNLVAADVYAKTEGVNSIVALVDSRMDGWDQITAYNNYDGCQFGDFYPDLRNLTAPGKQRLAQQLARLYCASDTIRGVQIDLEPFRAPYEEALTEYLSYVAEALVDKDQQFGCRNDMYPNGRAVSYFTFAHNHKPAFLDTLGPNGYFVFSGYDLFPKDDAFSYNNVTEFKQKLKYEIQYFRPVLGTTGRFSLALPISASCHEYEQYVPMKGNGCGPACAGITNQAQMHEYVQAWFDVLLDPETTNSTGGLFCLNTTASSQFVGISLWGFSFEMTYPPMKWFANDFLPPSPSDQAMMVVRANLPKLSDGTTCISGDKQCVASSGRPNGCPCDHSWECSSNWCTGVCHAPAPTVDFYGKPL